MKPEVDCKRIEAELVEAAGSIPCKVRPHKGARLFIRETDKLTEVRINPKKIRTQAQLDGIINDCQMELSRTRQTSTTIRQCGYCGYKGTDVNHVGHYYIGGKGDVEFPICDDAGACISRWQ